MLVLNWLVKFSNYELQMKITMIYVLHNKILFTMIYVLHDYLLDLNLR
jgi:hypothetical protein